MTEVILKRIYEAATADDGVRILVDRLWPRGVSKEKAKLDYWLKELGPSNDLRKALHHEEMPFEVFEAHYKQELESGEQKQAMEELKEIVKNADERVSILFSAKDKRHNNAIVIKELINK